MTNQEWTQAYESMTNDTFAALLKANNAHIDEDEERSGKCIDCGAKIAVMRKYVIVTSEPENQVVFLGRFRDQCC